MNIVVLVKQVPDTWAERKLKDADGTLDRASVDGLINELDEYAIEEGLQIAEAQRAAGADAEVTILTMGPEKAAESTLPAVISVVEKINEPRYPSFKGIMAAKKKPVQTMSLADAGIDPALVGLGGAATEVVDHAQRPPRQAGTVVKDEGDGGVKVAEFLAAQKFI